MIAATLPDYLILLIVGGFILLTVWRVLIPIGRGLVESWRAWRRADEMVRRHKARVEFDRLKDLERK